MMDSILLLCLYIGKTIEGYLHEIKTI